MVSCSSCLSFRIFFFTIATNQAWVRAEESEETMKMQLFNRSFPKDRNVVSPCNVAKQLV